jgi:hypothetical protein
VPARVASSCGDECRIEDGPLVRCVAVRVQGRNCDLEHFAFFSGTVHARRSEPVEDLPSPATPPRVTAAPSTHKIAFWIPRRRSTPSRSAPMVIGRIVDPVNSRAIRKHLESLGASEISVRPYLNHYGVRFTANGERHYAKCLVLERGTFKWKGRSAEDLIGGTRVAQQATAADRDTWSRARRK